MGLSPRRRGNQREIVEVHTIQRSIPASAGEPSYSLSGTGNAKVYPRVGGGTIDESAASLSSRGLSPRRRGNLLVHSGLLYRSRSIPASAGEPPSPRPSPWPPWVYPRVGGGTDLTVCGGFDGEGLSPRRRGNPHEGTTPGRMTGSIPASAAEPRVIPGHAGRTGVYPRVGGGTSPVAWT